MTDPNDSYNSPLPRTRYRDSKQFADTHLREIDGRRTWVQLEDQDGSVFKVFGRVYYGENETTVFETPEGKRFSLQEYAFVQFL